MNYFGSIPTTPIIIDHNSLNRTITVSSDISPQMELMMVGEKITASILNGLDYTADPNANSKSVEIVDDDTAPHSVSLSAPVSVIEGKPISVTLTANPST